MTIEERDLYRLSILKKLCVETDFDLNESIMQMNKIIQVFGIETDEQYKTFLSAVSYLNQKGYLESKTVPVLRGVQLYSIKPTVYGIDLIERIERKTSLSSYEEDFSRSAIMSLGNINNSNVVINSSNVSITLTDTVSKINELPDCALSEEEKVEIISQLNEIKSQVQDKQTRWEKIKGILRWIADKSVDVGVAVLPYLSSII